MGDHRDDLMYSADAAECRSLGRLAEELGLRITSVREELHRTTVVYIHTVFPKEVLVHKAFEYRESDWNINVWVRKQLNDYQSWR